MHQTLIVCAGILGLSLILSVAIYIFGRLRIEQQITLQRLIERGSPDDGLLRAQGIVDRRGTDLRRGLLLLAIGLSWSTVTFFVGGSAWLFGAFPIALGLAFLLLRVLDGRPS